MVANFTALQLFIAEKSSKNYLIHTYNILLYRDTQVDTPKLCIIASLNISLCVGDIKTLTCGICDCLCKNQPSSHKNFNSFLAQLIAILNSYPHRISPMARLNWSAFLRGGFMALQNHDQHIDTCGAHQLGVIGLDFYP